MEIGKNNFILIYEYLPNELCSIMVLHVLQICNSKLIILCERIIFLNFYLSKSIQAHALNINFLIYSKYVVFNGTKL